MNIITSVERARGCGYRKPGGLYLRTDGQGRICGALPIPLSVCPTCSQGIKPARGWTWINIAELGATCNLGAACGDCPLADGRIQRAGLIWVGEKFYPDTASFMNEANVMGLSRRINSIPRGFVLGETWVALAHRKAIQPDLEKEEYLPGIFHIFKPARIEYILKEGDEEEQLQKMEDRGITLINLQRAE